MPRGEQPHTVKCPTCGTAVDWTEAQRWRPFCSERCKLIDLGSWFDESNRIPDGGISTSSSDADG